MGSLMQDARYALRTVANNPGFAAVAVLTLALGLGPTTMLFSAMGGVLLRPLPFEQPEELVWIWEVTPQGRRSTTSAANFLDWRRESASFSQMAAYDFLGFDLGGLERPENLTGAAVSANLFSVLGVRAAHGRTFLPEEETAGSSHVVVVSHRLWQRQFGGRTDALGRTVVLNDRPYTVIGVLPEGFWFFLDALDVFVPLSWDPAVLADRGNRGYDVIARPRRGVTLQQAQDEMTAVASRFAAVHPRTHAGWGARLERVQENYLTYFRPAMRLLGLMVSVVLVVTGANVTNMLLARGMGRRREYAIRVALGAPVGALVRLVLIESLLVTLLGAGLALWLVAWTRGALVAILPGELQRRLPGGVAGVGVDLPLVLLTAGLAVATGLLVGLLPAWRAMRCGPAEALKAGGAVAGGDSGRLRNGLVAWQVGFCVVALSLAMLLFNTFSEVSRASPGFRTEGVLRVGLSLSRVRYPGDAQRAAFYERVLERVSAVPGVESAALASGLLPPVRALGGPFDIEGRPEAAPSDAATANVRLVSPDYFRKLGIALLSGRSFHSGDGQGAPGAAILSRSVAEKHWPGGDAVGRRIRIRTSQGDPPWLTVVGIAEDVRHPLDNAGALILYRPIAQAPTPFASLLVLSARRPEEIRPAVEQAVWSLDRELAIWGAGPLTAILSEDLSHLRFTTTLTGLFALITLGLAALGVYGANSYAVSRRLREIGVRMALGAGSKDIRGLVIGQGMKAVALGMGLGLAATAALARLPLVASQLQGLPASEFVFYAVSAVVLGAAALAGCLWPSRRAVRVDPLVVLRHE